MEDVAALLAQQQLDAYNQQNIEEFLEVYSEDVVVMHFPGDEIVYTGKNKMRERYSQLFRNNPNQHAELLSRMVKGNIVIDHEYVTGRSNGPEIKAIAMYETRDKKIQKVWFVK
ncbi:nuclear transport factor 2 family protein [Bacillus sp. ISL-47]|uniref:nuclear transport factor 2 family protein n=1 Tax=Bacillus sp. ISL-47 TaxID=2819130 RepID=UPI001BE5250C|nr:nuclear transport factor 2 family protein [Bacillus sp. ISL-47]MBT2689276.1 nuclear transport factor 2 family protein [Bacillus sp. ISL-47]MBT2707167.1 nuclear transport factor 2 family protein [Pseudomonas sp. ISL-84]